MYFDYFLMFLKNNEVEVYLYAGSEVANDRIQSKTDTHIFE